MGAKHTPADIFWSRAVALAAQARAERAAAANYPRGSIGRIVATRIAMRREREVRGIAKEAMSDLATIAKTTKA